ncbi:MAG TPA: hypothetical protein VHB21_11405 [Minicystis sp.]|nr:hypothetical protein [Minicystis sp.]
MRPELAKALAGTRRAKARLSNFEVNEVSLVDRAANLRRFAIVKRDLSQRGHCTCPICIGAFDPALAKVAKDDANAAPAPNTTPQLQQLAAALSAISGMPLTVTLDVELADAGVDLEGPAPPSPSPFPRPRARQPTAAKAWIGDLSEMLAKRKAAR